MLPSRPAIESACVDLMSLMFPGFHGEPLADSSDLPDVTRSRIKSLHARMKPEISKSFGQLDRDTADAKAEEILTWFMSELGRLAPGPLDRRRRGLRRRPGRDQLRGSNRRLSRRSKRSRSSAWRISFTKKRCR